MKKTGLLCLIFALLLALAACGAGENYSYAIGRTEQEIMSMEHAYLVSSDFLFDSSNDIATSRNYYKPLKIEYTERYGTTYSEYSKSGAYLARFEQEGIENDYFQYFYSLGDNRWGKLNRMEMYGYFDEDGIFVIQRIEFYLTI